VNEKSESEREGMWHLRKENNKGGRRERRGDENLESICLWGPR
jgi:hypothetical protein